MNAAQGFGPEVPPVKQEIRAAVAPGRAVTVKLEFGTSVQELLFVKRMSGKALVDMLLAHCVMPSPVYHMRSHSTSLQAG